MHSVIVVEAEVSNQSVRTMLPSKLSLPLLAAGGSRCFSAWALRLHPHVLYFPVSLSLKSPSVSNKDTCVETKGSSELATARAVATITCVLAETQKQAEGWKKGKFSDMV